MTDRKIIKVGMADLNAIQYPGILTTLGLGSCVGVALYDPITRIGGLAHVMLPDSKQIKNNSNIAKFADTATYSLVDQMESLGARKERIVAKLAGGAQMFAFSDSNDLLEIGTRNIMACKQALQEMNIRIIAEDVGKNYGRTIELYTESGKLTIKTIGHGIKEI